MWWHVVDALTVADPLISGGMFVKVTASGNRRYVQLVESYRDDAGRVKKRTVATLGCLDQLGGELDSVISGLLKVSGRQPASTGATPAITFESARALGDVWTLTELWNSLGFSELRRVFRRTRHAIQREKHAGSSFRKALRFHRSHSRHVACGAPFGFCTFPGRQVFALIESSERQKAILGPASGVKRQAHDGRRSAGAGERIATVA